jgi:GNAT superfamily N-acetyltransferase
VRVRQATPDDAEALERIRIRGWQVGYRQVFPAAELDGLAVDWSRWAEALRNPGWSQQCVVAEDAGGVVGWATYGPSDEPERHGRLNGLYVDPDHWGRGAGRALLAVAEAGLATTWDEAILWTLADNPRTRRFYEAAGWVCDGATGTFDRLGVSAPIVRYAKRLRPRGR